MPTLTLRVTLPKPHAAQRKVMAEARRWNAVSCGRRWGKSTLGIDRLVVPALEGYPTAWFSPTYKMLSDLWRETRRVVAPVTERVNAQEHRIELVTGGVIDMWSLENPDSVRGRKYKRAVIDEAAMVPNLADAWNYVVRPTLTDFEGDGWFLSTPKGRNFFWHLHEWGQDPHRPEYASWQMPTLANPFIKASEVEDARQNLPERVYQQEYLAQFLEDAGGVFRGVSECVDKGRTQNEPATTPGNVLGVDLARVEDFTVLTVLNPAGRQVYHERFNEIKWERQIATIERVAKQYHATVYLDSTGLGDPIFEQLRGRGFQIHGYQFTNASKEALIDSLAMALENGRRRLMDVPAQTTELLAYQYELTPSRNVRMNAPAGMHDDCVIALALANWGISQPSVGRPVAGGHRPVVQAYTPR
jgi:hypothetical protein